MIPKRIFKTKAFHNWAKKIISDAALCAAAREIEQNLFDADLGGGVCKKRISIAGQGKSGSVRTLLAKKHDEAIFFIIGREKNSPGSDFTNQEEEATKIIAKSLQKAKISQINDMAENNILKEICNDKKKC